MSMLTGKSEPHAYTQTQEISYHIVLQSGRVGWGVDYRLFKIRWMYRFDLTASVNMVTILKFIQALYTLNLPNIKKDKKKKEKSIIQIMNVQFDHPF